jgi:protein-glutamine gamma-glutamyltransferase
VDRKTHQRAAKEQRKGVIFMILISGNPPDMEALKSEYPENSVEIQLLKALSESNVQVRYDSIKQLKFELQLRKETVKAANQLHESGLRFAVFHKSKCNEDYWTRTENGGFSLNYGAEAGQAINDIFENGSLYATECATAMVIVIYKALLNVFGADLFNSVFQTVYLMNWHSLDPVIREIGAPREAGDILIGDRAYFKNPDVNPKTPEWQGENVIVLPDELYYGHGIGIMNANRIIRALNQNRKSGASRSAYLMQSVSRPNYKRLAEVFYGSAPVTASLQWRAFPASL